MAGIDRIAEGVGVGVSSMCCVRIKYGRKQVERREGGMSRCCGRRWGDWGTCSVGGGAGVRIRGISGDVGRWESVLREMVGRGDWRDEGRVLGKEGRETVWTGLGLGLSPLLCIQIGRAHV